MNDLGDIYRRLATGWTHDQLAAHYRSAEAHGGRLNEAPDAEFARPIPLIATAMPPSATASVAIHMLHALPNSAGGHLPDQLLDAVERNVADALHRSHRALKLDGAAHHYDVEEWLPTVYDIAGPLLQSSRLGSEPPTVVRGTQEVISWLSRALVELDEDSTEIPSSLAEALARLLTVWVFTLFARDRATSD